MVSSVVTVQFKHWHNFKVWQLNSEHEVQPKVYAALSKGL